jgi:FMN phosphatase YigB (HAD superfamily)
MRRLEAVIFDLGDTLVDLGEGRGSYEDRLVARVGRVYDVLAARGMSLPARDTFCADLAADSEAQYQSALRQERGLSVFQVMAEFLAERGLAHSEDVIDAAGEAYCTGGELLPAALRLGALETLRELHGWGILLGVISNTVQPERFMGPALIKRGIAPYIHSQFYSSDYGVAKPHPGIFHAALRRLSVAAENAVYVGDRIVPDIGGPKSVGMKAVLIEVAHRTERHDGIFPDARISELPELLGVLPELFDVSPRPPNSLGG